MFFIVVKDGRLFEDASLLSDNCCVHYENNYRRKKPQLIPTTLWVLEFFTTRAYLAVDTYWERNTQVFSGHSEDK